VAKKVPILKIQKGVPKGAVIQTERAFKQIDKRFGRTKPLIVAKHKSEYVNLYAKGMNKNLSWKVRGNAMRKLRKLVDLKYGWNPKGLNAYWKQYRIDYR